MPSYLYTGHFANYSKDGAIGFSEDIPFSIYSTETKSPSTSTKKQPSGWRPMTGWSASSRQPNGLWVGWTGSGTQKLRPEYGGDGWYSTIENPRHAYLGYPEELDLPDMEPDEALILKALTRVKDQQVNLGLVVSGAKQTLSTIVKDLTVWKEASKAVKRRDSLATFNNLREFANADTWRKRKRFLRAKAKFERDQKRFQSNYSKASADFWLALNFCYMQLAQDIDGSVKELDRPAAEPFVHGRSGSRTEVKGSWQQDSQPCHPAAYFGQVSFRKRASRSGVRYVHLAYMVDNSDLRRLSQVGLTNPLAIAYDVMPWTWVFDWVLPLGKWINNLDATVGLSWLDGCIGEKYISGFEVSAGVHVASAAYTSSGSYMPELLSDNRFTRTKLLQEPKMSDLIPKLRSPFKDPLWKIATTAALIAQLKR